MVAIFLFVASKLNVISTVKYYYVDEIICFSTTIVLEFKNKIRRSAYPLYTLQLSHLPFFDKFHQQCQTKKENLCVCTPNVLGFLPWSNLRGVRMLHVRICFITFVRPSLSTRSKCIPIEPHTGIHLYSFVVNLLRYIVC